MIRLLILAAVFAAVGEAAAVSLTLSDADKETAIRVGERSITSDTFDREWRVVNGGGDSVTVMTPFHRLALAARNATFKKAPLTPSDVNKLVKQDAGRLVVWVLLRGKSEDFARHYAPRITSGTREILPAFVQNERTAMRREDGTYLARCIYGFPIRDLTPRSSVGLVVADADGKDVSKFTIDLSVMR